MIPEQIKVCRMYAELDKALGMQEGKSAQLRFGGDEEVVVASEVECSGGSFEFPFPFQGPLPPTS